MSRAADPLPCGVALEALVAQVAEREPAADPRHEAVCPYCQAALRDLAAGWEDLRALAGEPVPIPPDLTARIMARVRALAGLFAESILIGHPRGQTRISHTLVGQVAQRLAATVPGVAFASARPSPVTPAEPARIAVALRLVVVLGPAIDGLARAVRAALDRHLPVLTGAEPSRIDILVEDVVDPHAIAGASGSRASAASSSDSASSVSSSEPER